MLSPYLFFRSLLSRRPPNGYVVKWLNGAAQWAAESSGGGGSGAAGPLVTLTCRIVVVDEAVTVQITRCKTDLPGVTEATFTPTWVEDGRVRISWPSDTFPEAVSSPPPDQGHGALPIRRLGEGGPIPAMITETGVNLVEVFTYDTLSGSSSPPYSTLNHDFLLLLFGN